MRHWIDHLDPIAVVPLIGVFVIWPLFSGAVWLAAAYTFAIGLALARNHVMHCREKK